MLALPQSRASRVASPSHARPSSVVGSYDTGMEQSDEQSAVRMRFLDVADNKWRGRSGRRFTERRCAIRVSASDLNERRIPNGLIPFCSISSKSPFCYRWTSDA